ncbi:MAG: Uma2 family endonuclease [Rubritepida sp.]|nr:Uma2 family endonuclease [Rubritepida sp.]
MSQAAMPPRMDRDAFIAWAITQDVRYELDHGEVLAMTPELLDHVRAKQRTFTALDHAIQKGGLACEVIGDGFGVVVDDDCLYQPGALVVCSERLPGHVRVTSSPSIIVEVTSPSNSRVDTQVKLVEYAKLPSLAHYLIVHLQQRVVIHYQRAANGQFAVAILGHVPLVLDPPGLTIQAEELLG